MRTVTALVRRVHLLSGLTLALGVLFYTISGASLIYPRFFPSSPSESTVERVAIPATTAASDRGLREFVASAVGSRGRSTRMATVEGGALRKRWVSPSGVTVADVSPDRTELTITTTPSTPLRFIRSLHTLRGRDGGAAYAAWWVFLDLVALSMIGFALSGIYLWYRTTRDRRLGWAILGGSWAFTLGLILYLMVG